MRKQQKKTKKKTEPIKTTVAVEAPDRSPTVTVGEILLLVVAFSTWTGLIEQIPPAMGRVAGAVVRLSPHYVWMTPLSDAIFFLVGAGGILAAGLLWPRARSRPVVLAVFFGVATLAVGFLMEKIYPVAVLFLAVGVGAQVARRARPAPRRRRFLPAAAGLGLLLVAALTVRSVLSPPPLERRAAEPQAPPPAGAPNILLVILDTARGISLDFTAQGPGASEWQPVRAPALASLAEESLVFTQAFAPSPWTLPSHASMFTGRWPNHLSDQRGFAMTTAGGLPTGYPTVAEALTRRGYLTGGFVGNLLFASAQVGLARGFQTYRDYQITLAQILLSSGMGREISEWTFWRRLVGFHDTLNRKHARVVTDEFLNWQARLPDRPFFAFINYFDAHEPYFPPDSVKAALPDGSRWDHFKHLVRLVSGATAWRAERWNMDAAEQHAHAAAYHDGLLHLDREVSRLLSELERSGVLDHTVVIVAGDHGEQLGEHDLYNHMNSLYLPVLHVPLLIHDPRAPERVGRVTETVSLRHLGATILDLAGVEREPTRIQGRTLLGHAGPEEGSGDPGPEGTGPDDTVFAVLYGGAQDQPWYPSTLGPAMFSLVDSAYHYILNGDGSEELYARRDDPGEKENLAFHRELGPVLISFRRTLAGLEDYLPPLQQGPPFPSPPPEEG